MEKIAFLEVIGLIPLHNAEPDEVSLPSEADKKSKEEISVHHVVENMQSKVFEKII